MKQTVAIGLATLVAALLACKQPDQKTGSSATTPAQAATPTVAQQPRTPDATLEAKELLDAYKANEVGADGRFKGKWLKVTGKVGDIKKDIMDDPYVTLGTGAQFEIPQAQAFFGKSDESKLATLSKGATQTVLCRCDGLMMNVLLRDCAFVP